MINTMQRVMKVLNREQEQEIFEMHQNHSEYFTRAEKWRLSIYKQSHLAEISIQISMLKAFLCQEFTLVRG